MTKIIPIWQARFNYMLMTACASALLLSAHVRVSAQEPVAFDGSKSREMEVVWTRTFAPGQSGFGAYLQNVADIPGNNMATVLVDNVYRTWPTTPALDTTSRTVEWIGGRAYDIAAPFDYDGIPPTEVFSGRYIFRPSLDGRIMQAIDTVDCLGQSFISPILYRVDVDNDGLLDIVSRYNGSGADWFVVVLNGAGKTRGCSKVLLLPNIYKNREQPERESTPVRLMRCADGKLRIVYVGAIHSYRSGIYLLDVNVQQTDTGYAVDYTVADSIEQRWSNFGGEDPWIIRPRVCVDDAKQGHQYALVDWQDGWHRNHNTTVMYEVTNGKLVERVSTVGHLNFSMVPLENAFDDGEAIIVYGGGGFTQFARISEFYRPFAKLKPGTTGSGFAFIDDQFNDGSRDMLTASQSNGFIKLVNFDLRPTSVQTTDTGPQSWVQLETGRLRLSLEQPSSISVEAVNLVGQKRPIVTGFHAPSGPTVLDITPQLNTLPNGVWFVRVSDGVRVVSLSYLR